jgi:hypothetical protein
MEFSPIIAGRFAANTAQGSYVVFNKIYGAMAPDIISDDEDRWPFYEGRITKKVLLNIPDGYFIASNVVNPNDLTPQFSATLDVSGDREAIWRHIKELGIAQTKVYVFKSMKGYSHHLRSQGGWWKKFHEGTRKKLADERLTSNAFPDRALAATDVSASVNSATDRKSRYGKRPKKTRKLGLFEPIAVHVLGSDGIHNADPSTEAAWRDIEDVGRRLSCPPQKDETIEQYADRLRELLAPLDPKEYIDGAAVYMLRLIVDQYSNMPRSKAKS